MCVVSRLFASSGHHPSSLQNGRQADKIQSAVTAPPATGQAASSEVTMSLSFRIGRVIFRVIRFLDQKDFIVIIDKNVTVLPGLTCRARRRRTSSSGRVAVVERSRGGSSSLPRRQ